MNQVAARGRLVLHVAGRRTVLRALSPVRLEGDWAIPVLASVGALLTGTGSAELPTRAGMLRCEAHLSTASGSLLLRPGSGDEGAALWPADADPDTPGTARDGTARSAGSGAGPAGSAVQLVASAVEPTRPQQRRQDVRGPVNLPLRGAVLVRPGPVAPDATPDEDGLEVGFEGVTHSVSAGGLGLLLGPDAVTVPAGSRLYLELQLPDGPLVPAVLAVVRRRRDYVHAGFLDISAADRERLVRLVFAEERRQLASRRRDRADLP